MGVGGHNITMVTIGLNLSNITQLDRLLVHPVLHLILFLSDDMAAMDASKWWKRNRSIVSVWVNVINCHFVRSMMRSPVEIALRTYRELMDEFRLLRERWMEELESQH